MHFALHFAFAIKASTSSLVSMIWHLSTQELVQSLIGGPPLVILHCLSIWAFDLENPRMCSSDKKRNILSVLPYFINKMHQLYLCPFFCIHCVFFCRASWKSLWRCMQYSDNVVVEEFNTNLWSDPLARVHVRRHEQPSPFGECFSTADGVECVSFFQLWKCVGNPPPMRMCMRIALSGMH